MAGRVEDELMTWSPPPLSKRKSVLFNPYNVLEAVKGVEDWWSEGDYWCRRGGLGYWLAVSEEKRREIQQQYGDPDEQKMKLIECWMTHVFASWQWLSRAVGSMGQTQLAPLISSYYQPTTGMAFTPSNVLGAVRPVENWWAMVDWGTICSSQRRRGMRSNKYTLIVRSRRDN
ncbi:hypothetical protein GBAR_LOCUS16591 [Geodia barretti]|uniref:Uncharacterized protein n=1 Tax=Geodia barretti TaxID=519541 RepID=A0AA35SIB0_GEOBA|nr:hypothetical protein GBAR_LOCUS16591 [Geodia barretti]